MKRITFFAASLVAASVAIGGCSQDIGSSDEQTGTSDDELLTVPAKLRLPPNMFWTFPIKTEAEDRALAARIVAAGRMNIDPLRSTAVDGMVPVPDTTKRCRMTGLLTAQLNSENPWPGLAAFMRECLRVLGTEIRHGEIAGTARPAAKRAARQNGERAGVRA